jgi:putative radical SAM enzyme (TIGR03279 family)
LIAAVESGSPAEAAGLTPGDRILQVDDAPLRDVIDWRWHTSEDAIELLVARQDAPATAIVLARQPGSAWGIEFSSPVFDSVRRCANDCVFCFMSQLPEGLRPSLYIRDDDYRLSFLQGNYVTLTNLSSNDISRIASLRLSPLHVSLHATDPAVRHSLLCHNADDRAVDMLDELQQIGIEFHVQIVLVPGVNDGSVLEQTLSWLFERAGIVSVGVVPVGYTRFQSRISASYDEPEAARVVIDQLGAWRESALTTRGTHWVHGADELYLNAGRDIPDADAYDGFPQYENGIGMVRTFADELERAASSDSLADASTRHAATVITGTLFAPHLEELLARSGQRHVRVLPAKNGFFGGNVSVAGLLTAQDLIEAMWRDDSGGPYLIPDSVLNDARLTLDDLTFDEIAARANADVRLVSCDATALVRALAELQPPLES